MKHIATEVLVVGGGTAGVMAALSAARNGAKVILAERDGALGGVAARAGIHLYYYGLKAGSQVELDDEIHRAEKAIGWPAQGFHPEAKRLVSAQMLAEAGVETVYFAQAVEVIKSGNRVGAVVFETPEEALRIDAAVTVDATGDGDLCALAGASYTVGRDWDQVMNNYSLVPRCLYNDRIGPFNVDGGWVDSTSARDVSRAYLEGRSHLFRLLGDAIAHEGFIATPPHLGVREGRLILGEAVLTLSDLAENRTFPDAVMRCMTHFDTHAYDFANESLEAQIWVCIMGLWKERIGSEVPFRCFIPKGIDGLLIGCRALSMTHDAAVGFRMQRDIQQVGEVAGTAAALCAALRCEPRELDVAKLQERLVAQGVLKAERFARERSSGSSGGGVPGGSAARAAGGSAGSPAGSAAQPAAGESRDGSEHGGVDGPLGERPWVQVQFDEGCRDGLPAEVLEEGLTVEALDQASVIERLIDALATDQAGKALWWLRRAGDKALAPLRARLALLEREVSERMEPGGAEGGVHAEAAGGAAGPDEAGLRRVVDHRRAVATALALIGDGSGAAHLLESVKARDARTPPGVRSAPYWIASLICLKLLRDPSAAGFLIERLPEEKESDAILHILHYLLAVVDRLDQKERERLEEALHRLLAWTERGAEYRVWGGVPQSMQWSIDLACAALLVRLSDPEGPEIFDRLSRDHRGYVRRAASWIRRRMGAGGGSLQVPGDRYDVVISGGGVGGLACAVALARQGYKTLVVERRGGLGWEISRARRVFFAELLDPSSQGSMTGEKHRPAVIEEAGSSFLSELWQALGEAGALRSGVVHAPVAELVFDRIASAYGIDLLFHAQAVRVEEDAESAQAAGEGPLSVPEAKFEAPKAHHAAPGARLVAATREGYVTISASWIVETDQAGRLVPERLRSPLSGGVPAKVVRSVVVKGVEVEAMRKKYAREELFASLGFDVRPLSSTLVQIDLMLPQAESAAEREVRLRGAVQECLERLRAFDPIFAGAGVVYIADDEWASPPFSVGKGVAGSDRLHAGAAVVGCLCRASDGKVQRLPLLASDFPRDGRLIFAGPWLAAVLDASSGKEVSVIDRVLVGEGAARLIQQVQ